MQIIKFGERNWEQKGEQILSEANFLGRNFYEGENSFGRKKFWGGDSGRNSFLMVVYICTKFRKNSSDGFKCINFAFLTTEQMRKSGMLWNLGKNCMILLPFIK